MERFDVRRRLAEVLGGERGDYELVGGPLAAYRGQQADYASGGGRSVSVPITDPAPAGLGLGKVRRATFQTPNDIIHSTLRALAEVDW